MVSEANAVHNWLRTTWRISVPDDWLQACIEWIHSENEGAPASSVSDLCELVFEQWLVCDLREIGASCLPQGLAEQPKCTLNGSYGLQVNSVVDVGCSFYGQLQKVKGTENSNASVSATQPTQPAWEPKPSRMLMMRLTDGTQEIQAMEYQSIPVIKSSLLPGSKIVVCGNVLCRRGVLMLKSENVRVLGGEVESLAEEITVEKILSDSLQHNIDANSGTRDLPRKAFAVEPRKVLPGGGFYESVASGGKPKMAVAGVMNSRCQATIASGKCNRGVAFEENIHDIPDDDLVTIATSVDVQWGEEDFDYSEAMEITDNVQPPTNLSNNVSCRSSVSNNQSSSASAKRLSSANYRSTAQTALTKKQRVDEDAYASWVVPEDVRNIDFDDDFDDLDWQTTLASVSKAKQIEAAAARTQVDAAKKQSKTLSSKLCARAGMAQPNTLDVSERREPISERLPLPMTPREEQSRTFLPNLPSMAGSSVSEAGGFLPASLKVSVENNTVLGEIGRVSDNSKGSHFSEVTPFTYLSRLMKQQNSLTDDIFCVKAYISTLVSRLEHNQGSHWSLVVKINDGSAAVDVQLSNEILTDLIGFSAAQCMTMRHLAKSDRSVKQKLAEGIQRCQDSLVQLSTIMELAFSSSSSAHPMLSVLRFRPVGPADVELLSNRVRNCRHN